MIKFFIYSLLALIVGLFLSIYLKDDPGYVLISFQEYSIETSLVVSFFSAILIFILLYALSWIVRTLNPIKIFKQGSKIFFAGNDKAKLSTEKGLLQLASGQSQSAYNTFLQKVEKAENPLINYLAAALAAFQMGDRNAWNYCLNKAGEYATEDKLSIRSLKALLEFKSGNLELSLAILMEIKKSTPGNKYVLLLIKDIYVALADWEHLSQIMPELEKTKALKEDELISLYEKVLVYKFDFSASTQSSSKAMAEIWRNVPKKLQQNETIVACYLQNLHRLGEDAEAAELLTKFLKNQWSDKLVRLMGFIESNNPQHQLVFLEGWVKNRPNNAMLMMTLGRLSLRNKLWGKAKEYFECALTFSKNDKLTAEINAELGRLLDHMGEHEKSTACYRKAIEMDKKLPDLPMPDLL